MKISSLFIVVAILGAATLTSCTLPGVTEKNFSSIYEGHVDRVFSVLEDSYKQSYLNFEGEEKGNLRIAADVANMGSGQFFIESLSRSKGWKMASADMSLTGEVNIMGEGFVVKDLKGNLTSYLGKTFMKLDSLDITGSTINQNDLTGIKKYFGKWISFNQSDISGDPEVAMMEAVTSNLLNLTTDDIKTYLKSYPILRALGTGTTIGNNYVYDVQLDRDNTQRFIEALYSKVTGSGVTPDAKNSIAEGLSGTTIQGKLSVDKEDLLYFTFSGVVRSGDTQTGADIIASVGRDTYQFSVLQLGNGMMLDGKNINGKWNSTLKVRDNGTDMVTLTFVNDDKNLISLNGSFEMAGMIGKVDYVRTDDGSFSGMLNLPMGNTLQWGGKYEGGALLALNLDGNFSQVGSFTMNLTPTTDGWIAGPISMKEGTNEVMKGDIKLLMKKETFGLRADVIPSAAPVTIHIEMDANSSHKNTPITIDQPKDAIPVATVAQELNFGSNLIPDQDSGDMNFDSTVNFEGPMTGTSMELPEDVPEGEVNPRSSTSNINK